MPNRNGHSNTICAAEGQNVAGMVLKSLEVVKHLISADILFTGNPYLQIMYVISNLRLTVASVLASSMLNSLNAKCIYACTHNHYAIHA